MESDLLIDLGESVDCTTKDEMHKSLGRLDITTSLDPCLGEVDVGVSKTVMTCPMSTKSSKHLFYPDSTILTPFKSLSDNKGVWSSSSSIFDCNKLPGVEGIGRAQSLTFGDFNSKDSSEILSPFGCSANKSATTSLQSVCLQDSEPSKLLSPFGTLVSWDDKVSKNETTNEVPVGDLLEVTEEAKLPEDMFDIEVLEKKQTQNITPKGLNVIISTTASSGSGDFSSDGTMNRGFIDTGSSVDGVVSTLDDSVFEEALALAEEFSKMAVKGTHSALDNIENEDESIVYECPDWKDDNMDDVNVAEKERDCFRTCAMDKPSGEDVGSQRTYEGGKSESSPSIVLNSIMGTPQESKNSNSSFRSSASSISPIPLSSNGVDLIKLKAGEIIGSQLSVHPLKLRASSSTAPAKNVPIKALIPLDKLIQRKTSSSSALNVAKKPVGTPRLKVTFPSPPNGNEKPNVHIMSSTPKLNISDNHSNHASSVKTHHGHVTGLNNRWSLDSKVKPKPEASSTPFRLRASSSGKVNEFGKMGTMNGNSAKKAVPSPIPAKKFLNGPVHPSTIKKQSPVLRKKNSSGSGALKTPSRSSSTGSLPTVSSEKTVNSSPQFTTLLSHAKSTSTSSQLHFKGRALADASVNSPAKASSPLRKILLKFRRNMPSKGMKENFSPI